MRSFDEILEIAAERKGGRAAVLDRADGPKTAADLAATPDDRWLSQMSKSIFQAGFSWTVIEAKWPGFEEAFGGFAPGPLAVMPEERFDALMQDRRIVRNGTKIRAVQENAVFVTEVAREAGSFGRKIADWPGEDYAGLLYWLKQNGSRLGGTSAQYFLRVMGKDSYILSRDGAPTSRKAMGAVQEAFNDWAAQSGQSLTTISRVLAQSIG
ncbi:DNA-3-methyladenine glycosylase I [Ovoidimarina sediminis]|uniref:DNA-3-methyladenine glycosylase I n=1 Tax=Ovoidimarina sediminis TaxID=3079856 RepID=UPI0029089909|nr:DNA-3-methyladenine glycosylase I [Rhodophyticola sp. MJ-SS7]MDU8943420.1 DNA-3-methyladenine glycosylase I [Rhodophyticola sp. MJ-SS7]